MAAGPRCPISWPRWPTPRQVSPRWERTETSQGCITPSRIGTKLIETMSQVSDQARYGSPRTTGAGDVAAVKA